MSFGSNLKRERLTAGIAQSKDLAAKLHKSAGVVSRWETDGTGPPKADTLIEIATVLDCSIEALLDGVDGYQRRDLIRHGVDQQSGLPSNAEEAHDPVAARVELQELRDLVARYEKEAREMRTATDSIVKVAFALEQIRKTPKGKSGRSSRDRKVG